MSWLDFTVCALATWGAVEAWNHGEIFAEKKAKLEAREGFVADLVSCPFCISYWFGGAIFLWFALASYTPWLIISVVLKSPVWACALARVANLANDVTHMINRTPDAYPRLRADEVDEDST